MAHDKALGQTGIDTPSESAEAMLVKQIELLAAQIIKIREETSSEGTKASASAINAPMRVVRAMPTNAADTFSHPGVNF